MSKKKARTKSDSDICSIRSESDNKPLNIMSFDDPRYYLDELEKKLDESLNNETPESIKKWLQSKRSNER